jgi:rod shape-determining protein MreD
MISQERVSASGTPVILVSLLVAGWLELLPLPEMLDNVRPEWMCMTLLYWVLALPHRVGVLWGFGVGLFQDVLVGAVLGQHALAFAVVSYITLVSYKRLRVFPALQQSAVMFMLVGTSVLVAFTVQDAAGRTIQTPLQALLVALSSAVLWRVTFTVLRQLRRRFLVR